MAAADPPSMKEWYMCGHLSGGEETRETADTLKTFVRTLETSREYKKKTRPGVVDGTNSNDQKRT